MDDNAECCLVQMKMKMNVKELQFYSITIGVTISRSSTNWLSDGYACTRKVIVQPMKRNGLNMKKKTSRFHGMTDQGRNIVFEWFGFISTIFSKNVSQNFGKAKRIRELSSFLIIDQPANVTHFKPAQSVIYLPPLELFLQPQWRRSSSSRFSRMSAWCTECVWTNQN